MPAYRSGDNSPRPDYVEAGEYNVEVLDAIESISSAGNEMIQLKLKALPSGAVFYDHLVFTESSYWKVDLFRSSIGEKIETGVEVEVRCDDLIGRRGRARLIVEEFGGRKKNKVAAWLVGGARPQQPVSKGGVDDDDIPF
jgi:hypothetical protein